ncbi:MAG: hypothetical protein ACQPRJ_00295 [Solitalea-like symbiont of Acarus siro]
MLCPLYIDASITKSVYWILNSTIQNTSDIATPSKIVGITALVLLYNPNKRTIRTITTIMIGLYPRMLADLIDPSVKNCIISYTIYNRRSS